MSFIECNFLLSGNYMKKKNEFTEVCERMDAKIELKS